MLRNLQILQIYRLTDLYDFRSPGGPPAHARGLQHEALRRGGSAALQEGGGSEMGVVARRERCVNSFPRAHTRTREEWRGGDVGGGGGYGGGGLVDSGGRPGGG